VQILYSFDVAHVYLYHEKVLGGLYLISDELPILKFLFRRKLRELDVDLSYVLHRKVGRLVYLYLNLS